MTATATDAAWCAGYGAPNAAGLGIDSWTRLVEFRPWDTARNDMISMMQQWAANEDHENMRTGGMTANEHLVTDRAQAVLAQLPPEVDQEYRAVVESWTGDRIMFVVERDRS